MRKTITNNVNYTYYNESLLDIGDFKATVTIVDSTYHYACLNKEIYLVTEHESGEILESLYSYGDQPEGHMNYKYFQTMIRRIVAEVDPND